MIHVYFGTFVIRRGIIFIDLALAQWAAIGYLLGHCFHIEHPILLFAIAFSMSALAGGILTLLRPLCTTQNLLESMIGVMYILGSTICTSILAISQMEGHHLTDMLSGHLLFVSKGEIISGMAIYLICGLSLYKLASIIPRQSRAFDFLFYSLFALVVTSSVKMVGILLVFSYLVTPILAVKIAAVEEQKQSLYGWLVGIVGSILGLILSILIDIPPSYSIILCLGGMLFAVSTIQYLKIRKN